MRRAAFTACAALVLAAGPIRAMAAEKVTIAIGSTVIDVSQANDTSVPLQTGCWKRAGLDVEIQPTNTNAAIQALLTGRVDFVVSGPSVAIIARSKGADVESVYLNLRKNYNFLVVPQDSPIKTLAEFKGKSVGVFSYGAQLYRVFKGMIAEAGLNPDTDVTWIETGAGAQALAALRSGRVDAWGTWDSQIATAENTGLTFRSFTTPQAEKLDWGSSFFTTRSYAAAHPDTVGKVLRCVAQSTAFAMANPEAAVRAHWAEYPASKPNGMPEATAMKDALHILTTRLAFLKLPPGGKWGEMPEGSAATMVNFMKQTGELKGDVKPQELFTNQFVAVTNDFDPAQPLKVGP